MNSASCLLPLAIVGIPTMLFCIERDQERRREAARRACFDFDLSLARRRYREQTECDETEALRVEEEFRRFFLLIAENPDTQFGLHNGQIDDFWHELICCTALYRDYCTQTAGRFIHHDPLGGSGDGYNRTWWAYHDRFLETPDARYWPEAGLRQYPLPVQSGWGGGCGGSSCGGGGGDGGGGCCGGGCSGGCGGGH